MSENLSPLVKGLKKVGCAILLVGWFSFLLLPCALFALARDGQIVFSRSNLPGDDLIRIQLLSDTNYTGISMSTSRISRSEDGLRACVWRTVRYLFWRGDQVNTVQFCECFQRDDQSARWTLSNDKPAASCQIES